MAVNFDVNKFLMSKRGHCFFNLLMAILSFSIPMIASIFGAQLDSVASVSLNGLGGMFSFAAAWFAFQSEENDREKKESKTDPEGD